MRAKFVTLVAALFLLGACETTPEESGEPSSSGGTDSQVTTSSPEATGLPAPAAGSQEDLAVQVGDRVFFDYDSSDITPDARGTVEKLAVWLNGNPSVTITVEGHADERGTREYNLALGERRSNSVRNYLVALGISPNRVTTISYEIGRAHV